MILCLSAEAKCDASGLGIANPMVSSNQIPRRPGRGSGVLFTDRGSDARRIFVAYPTGI